MKNVRIYSFTLSPDVISKIDQIIDGCAIDGVTVTRSKVINTILDAGANDGPRAAWIKYFIAADEYAEAEKLSRKG